jgi:hypothetical protein
MPIAKLDKYDTGEFHEGNPNEYIGSLASLRKQGTG